ncbi:MAG: nicotinamide riboside transporter PnuC [Flavobacterium sp.]
MIDFFFKQYENYATSQILIELIAIGFGLASVVYSKKNKVAVFPTGMSSTALFVYLLWQWELLGDMLINAYYFMMSIYGWWVWTSKDETNETVVISTINRKEMLQAIILFLFACIFVVGIYVFFNKFTHWTAYVDTLTTGIFFAGMWLMAKRKVENWLFWIIGDLISIPLYFFKGYTFTSLQYLIFTILAIYGYQSWKKILHKSQVIVSK